MLQCQLKLRMTKAQEREAERWLFHLASIWNWGVRKIELNAADKIYFSQFGKSVASSGHYQLRQMLSYKSRAGGTEYVEVDCRNSTKTCSTCGALSGPTGLSGLAVRQWTCACGSRHDRDVNAAVNTLIAGAGRALGGQESWRTL